MSIQAGGCHGECRMLVSDAVTWPLLRRNYNNARGAVLAPFRNTVANTNSHADVRNRRNNATRSNYRLNNAQQCGCVWNYW